MPTKVSPQFLYAKSQKHGCGWLFLLDNWKAQCTKMAPSPYAHKT